MSAANLTFSIYETRGVPVEEWAKRIRRDMGMTVEIVVRIGQTLRQAKEDFEEQEKTGALPSAKAAWADLLNQSQLNPKSAWALLKIGSCNHLSTTRHKAKLPTGWTVLRELALLPEPEFRKRLKAGEIHPEVTRKEIQSWKAVSPGRKKASPGKPDQKDAAYQAWKKEKEAAEPEMSVEELFGLVKQALKVTPLEFKQAADEDFGQSKWWAAKTLIEHEKKVLKSLAPLNKTSRKAALKAIVDILGHQELVIDHVVAVRVEHVAAQYREKYHQAADTQRQFHDLRRNLGKQAGLRGMDKKDAQVIRSALHSDRLNGISEADRKRLDNAFGIFKRYTDKEGITA